MTKIEATNEAVRQSQQANGERRYAVKWTTRDGSTHWTVETRKPGMAGECLLAIDGTLEHA